MGLSESPSVFVMPIDLFQTCHKLNSFFSFEFFFFLNNEFVLKFIEFVYTRVKLEASFFERTLPVLKLG